ncbi:DUF4157 domain-containing protein [Streptomyces sp. bgisy091]|uniref:eCIS core domain-containing protein n=1 Tax=Streptomyces sp. bgisy091 TaxID=3413778 RepID=UPI003D743AF1
MRRSRVHGSTAHSGDTEARQPVQGQASAGRMASPGGAVGLPPLTADALRSAQHGVGNAVVNGMIARRVRASAGHAPEQPDAEVREVLRSAGSPLARPVRQEMESRFGADFSDVRLHTGADARSSASGIGARAYTSGSHVVIGEGGGDKHTLAHELTHVLQQRLGPVSGTDRGDGLRVSDPSDRFEREAESNAHRVMTGPVPAESPGGTVSRSVIASDDAVARTAVVQRKGFEELSGGLPAPSSGRSVKSFLKSFSLGPVEEPGQLRSIREDIAAYDTDPRRDPAYCMDRLLSLLMAVGEAEEQLDSQAGSGVVKDFLTAARRALRAEKDLVAEQMVRDNSFPAEARPPYEAMTAGGMLWSEDAWTDSAAAFAMHGPSYFRELSELNRAGMSKEIAGRGPRDWVDRVKGPLDAALRGAWLCHYTDWLPPLAGPAEIKSKTELLRGDPDAANNSEAYDKHVLANEGFVFFVLEAPDSEFRDSRFGKNRIEIPLADSPLESQGWLMLSDFAQREYPSSAAAPAAPAETASALPTRQERMPAGYTLPVRGFDLGTRHAELDDVAMVKRMGAEPDKERASQIGYSMTQAAADQHSRMVYGPDDQRKEYEERLRSNTLKGRDIVPGLVDRAVLEIMRFEETNPQLANRLKSMSGQDLMRYMLRDLVRPQAMLPGTVDLGNATIRNKSGILRRPTPAT